MKHTLLVLIAIAIFSLSLIACSAQQAANVPIATKQQMDSIATTAGTDAPDSDTSTIEIQVKEEDSAADEGGDEIIRPEGWVEETHSKRAEPNYDVVFPQDKVNQITITIDPESWEAMQANMIELYDESGQQGPGRGFPSGGDRPQPPVFENGEMPEGFPMPGEGQFPPQGGPGGGLGFGRENPMWITATLEFEGNTWTNVGVRYKGNSSLMSSWNSGSSKLPLKLDFDEFEEDYPEIKNQRFYGFKQMSLANGFGDDTYLREAVAYDLLEEAGLVAAETAYYEVILDYGEGPINLGLYTAVEVIDDTVIERYFGNDKGNIYEADGQAVSLAEGTFDRIKDSFEKENNKDEADWSDIEALYNVLHSEERTTNSEAWRAELESIFDVDAFLKWLAISAAIQHWDTYGGMSHNFYLYHNPDTDQLVWISWDHNLVLGSMGGSGWGDARERRPGIPTMRENPSAPTERSPEGQQQQPAERMEAGGQRGGGPRGGRNVSLDKANVGNSWPLIRYLLDDPAYYERYLNGLVDAGNLLNPEALMPKYQPLAEVLGPYADNPDTFDSAVQSLMKRISEQHQAVTEFLANR